MTNTLSIEPGTCIRCASCVNVAPGLFALGRAGSAWVTRQPTTADDERHSRAAQINCPTGAVRLGRALSSVGPGAA